MKKVKLVCHPAKFWMIFSMLILFSVKGVCSNPSHEKMEILQSQKITGIVTDRTTGEPLPGVSIVVKDKSIATISDIDGKYALTASKGDKLLFSYIGFITKEIIVGNKTDINIDLEEDSKLMDEVVVVGYGVAKKATLTSAISNMKGDDISKNPVANLSNTLGGRVSGVISRQGSGEPGYDGSDILIRGRGTTGKSNALIIVDGIARNNYSQLDPNSIESITILKDAAAVAPYGLAGANGVILVTTKKGVAGKPSISYNGYVGFQNPTRKADMVNSYEYALMQNMGALNAGAENLPFSEEDIANYKMTVDGATGAHADRWPNSRGMKDIIEKNRIITNHSIEVAGGSQDIKYYVSLAYMSQEGQFKTTKMKRYNAQSKLDIKATKTTDVSLALSGYVQDLNYPGYSAERIMYFTMRTPPTSAIYFSNGLWGNYMGNSPVGAVNHSGYDKTDITQIYTTLSVEQKLPFIKGLSIKGVASYDPRTNHKKKWTIPVLSYTPDYSTDPITFNDVYNGGAPQLQESNNYDKKFTYQGYLMYENTFGDHKVSFLGVAERSEGKYKYNSAWRSDYSIDIDELDFGGAADGQLGNGGMSSRSAQIGFVYRAGYDFKGKYLAEIAGRYDGNYYFAPKSRWAFFPSVSLAWNVAEEKFVKDKFVFMDQFKLRTSYGLSGNLAGDPYQYLSGYELYSNAAIFDKITSGIYEKKQSNPEITWEKAKKFDVGFDMIMCKGLLTLSADYFYEKRDNMLMTPEAIVPLEYGIALPEINGAKMSNKGVDFTIGSNFTIANQVKVSLHGTFSYAKNKMEQIYETGVTYNNPNRRQTGRSYQTYFGYKSLGYYSEDDFDSNGKLKPGIASIKDANVSPGDIKYADVSGPDGVPDGIIDHNDNVVIGRPKNTPGIMYGFSPNISWKGFDLGALFQGAAQYDIYLYANTAHAFEGQSSATKLMFKDHWTPDNPNATYPRITQQPASHNQQQSSHWIRNAAYLRLKNLEVGYTLPKSLTQKIALENLRVYFSGQNIWTWTPKMKEVLDPEAGETSSYNYYQQSVFSFGVNLTF